MYYRNEQYTIDVRMIRVMKIQRVQGFKLHILLSTNDSWREEELTFLSEQSLNNGIKEIHRIQDAIAASKGFTNSKHARPRKQKEETK